MNGEGGDVAPVQDGARPASFDSIRMVAIQFTLAPVVLVFVAYLAFRGAPPLDASFPVAMLAAPVVLGVMAFAGSVWIRRFTLSHARPGVRPAGVAATSYFVGTACAEAIGLLGFTWFFIVRSWPLYAVMMLLWAVAAALAFPTRARWESWVAAAEQAQGVAPPLSGLAPLSGTPPLSDPPPALSDPPPPL